MIELLPIMPTTWSLVTSCLASEAICDGLVCSVTGKNLIGWPLIPPLALTQAKYAPVMFSMSLKSVPGCLVLIAPMLMGVPVAATPGLVPQAEVEVVPAAAEELDAEEAALVAAGALDDAAAPPVLELELELHAARTPSDSAATTAAAVRVRQWTDLFMSSAFSWLTASHLSSERVRAPPLGAASPPGLAERRRRSPDPQVNGASLHCFSDVV